MNRNRRRRPRRQRRKPLSKFQRLNILALILPFLAICCFASAFWVLGRDGQLDLDDALVLIGIFIFWRVLPISQAPQPVLIDTLLVVSLCAGRLHGSDRPAAWFMVLASSLLAVYYSRAGWLGVLYRSLGGDGRIFIAVRIGLLTLLSVLWGSPGLAVGVVVMLGAGLQYMVFVSNMSQHPLTMGAGWTFAHGIEIPIRRRYRECFLVLLLAAGMLMDVLYSESKSSWLQAKVCSKLAQKLNYQLQPGTNGAIHYPVNGPFDQRLGYTRLPDKLRVLQENGFSIEQQVRFSDQMLQFTKYGIFPPFAEKTQAGLDIFDQDRNRIYQHRYPGRSYATFDAIPPVVVGTLLYIENRDLLDTRHPQRNPAVDWGRFLKAIAFNAVDEFLLDMPSMGGSTLATQIEKYRHSALGITGSVGEKLQQMISASVRAYRLGKDTLPIRYRLIMDYLNTVPLSAAPGYGEVNGIGDGLHVWFDADFDRVNKLLSQPAADGALLTQQGQALRQMLALIIAHRRPSAYLVVNRSRLSSMVDSHLRILARDGVISPLLRDAALAQTLHFRDFDTQPAVVPAIQSKAVNVVRNRLATLLEVPLYELDRMDLSVDTTLNYPLQQKVTAHLRGLREVEQAQAADLIGNFLLKPDQVQHLRYSFTLFERTATGNKVRVQTDNTDLPFDINEGSKLELGSTAKLRVLASFLEVVAELYDQYAGKDEDRLSEALALADDTLSRWVIDQLKAAPDLTLEALLQATLDRRFSANPSERFFTGGGIHTFGNFKREDNFRHPSLRESLRESINLPFVRLLRELVDYHIANKWHDIDQVLRNDADPRRQEVLARFIDHESKVYLSRFWKKYQQPDSAERLKTLLTNVRPIPSRLAMVYRYLLPQAGLKDFSDFLAAHLKNEDLSLTRVQSWFEQYAPERYSLLDRASIAHLHPLELWLIAYLERAPNAELAQAIEESRDIRRQVYEWLLTTRAKNVRDSRIFIMLEAEAFTEIHRRWRTWGYPFDHLVPSLATALGSSGDRPAALAELMGVIINKGERLPSVRVERLQFGIDTPYETRLVRKPVESQTVMHAEVADALYDLLAEVVDTGTARRLSGVYVDHQNQPLITGGKTGTGDNRLMLIGPDGRRTPARAMSRTATFVFYLGERHFGTLTAFVAGAEAGQFSFTSALPVQVLKSLAPILQPAVMTQAVSRNQAFPPPSANRVDPFPSVDHAIYR